MRLLAGTLLSMMLLALGAPSARADSLTMVVELFTSQGCSSCPPADKLLGELGRKEGVITLSMPVDYWDYLGWKDTLADPAFTARQKAYAYRRKDRAVYTPQAVVNGVAHALGSDQRAIETAARGSRNGGVALSVPIKATTEGDSVMVTLPAGKAAGVVTVWLLRVVSSCEVQIGRGENSGRAITYTNVVRGMKSLGEWTGEARTIKIAKADIEGDKVDTIVVMLQAGTTREPGPILGAVKTTLP